MRAVPTTAVIQREDKFEQRKRIALLIGADEYKDSQIPNLPMVAEDVRALNDLLAKKWSQENVISVTGKKATKANILESIWHLAMSLSPDDMFLIYYSGHGYYDPLANQSYWMSHDTRFNLRLRPADANYISMEDVLKAVLANGQARLYAVVFITDACNPESPLERGFSFPAAMPNNFVGFASSRPDENSYIDFEFNTSAFTHYLLEGLHGNADREQKGWVTVFDLHRYISRKVQDRVLTRMGRKQTPMLSYHGAEDIQLIESSIPQEMLDAQRRSEQAIQFHKDMTDAAKLDQWSVVLDHWDRLLQVAPDYGQGFSTALKARQELDKSGYAYESEEIEELSTYPRVWICREEDPPVHPHTFVTHPDARKGDILLHVEERAQTLVIKCAYIADSNAFPGYSTEEKFSFYVVAENTRIDLSAPPVTLAKIRRVYKDLDLIENLRKSVEMRPEIGDLRVLGAWDILRHALLREHTYEARRFLQAELRPLRYGLTKEPTNLALRKAVEHLFSEYEKLATLDDSQFSLKEVEEQRTELWSHIPLESNVGSGDSQVPEGVLPESKGERDQVSQPIESVDDVPGGQDSGIYTVYENGLRTLANRLEGDSQYFPEFRVLEARLRTNMHNARRYGDDDNLRRSRAQVIESLNGLALDAVGESFNSIAEFAMIGLDDYESGVRNLLERLSENHPRFADALVLQKSLLENLAQVRKEGDSRSLHSERVQVLEQLESLARETTGDTIDPFFSIENRLQSLLYELGQDDPRYLDALVFEQRLRENITFARQYGDTDDLRTRRAQILSNFDELFKETPSSDFGTLVGDASRDEIQEAMIPSRELLNGILRVLDSNGNILAAAFMVKSDLAVTSTYVVESAGSGPDEKVNVAFEVGGEVYEAIVLSDMWDESLDIAFLQLQEPPPGEVRALPLGSSTATAGHSIRTFGYPTQSRDHIAGMWLSGRVIDHLQERSLLQIEFNRSPIGYGGAPVWDEQTKQVIGVISVAVQPDESSSTWTSFAIPSETLINLFVNVSLEKQTSRTEASDIDGNILTETSEAPRFKIDTPGKERGEEISSSDPSAEGGSPAFGLGALIGASVAAATAPLAKPSRAPSSEREPSSLGSTATSDIEYSAEMSLDDALPDSMLPGEITSISLNARNSGVNPWLVTGADAIQIGCRVCHELEVLNQYPYQLPRPLDPGKDLTMKIEFVAPVASGTYQLAWGLVRADDGAWFAGYSGEELLTCDLEVIDLPTISSLFRDLSEDRRHSYVLRIKQIAQQEISSELGIVLTEQVIDALFDKRFKMRRAALQVLYDLQDSGIDVVDRLHEVFSDLEKDLSHVRRLTNNPTIKAAIREWLEQFLPPQADASGATELRQEPAPLKLSAEVDENQKSFIVGVRDNYQQQVVNSLERFIKTSATDTPTLGIHIHPSSMEKQLQALSLLTSGDMDSSTKPKLQYWVVLTLTDWESGQLQLKRFYEGPLKLDEYERKYRDYERGDFHSGHTLHRALFHSVLPENDKRFTKGDVGQATLLTGYTSALECARSKGQLRVQLRIDTTAVDLHRYHWEYLWDPEGDRLGGVPLTCNERTPFARVLQVSETIRQPIPQISQDSPLRVLVVVASPAELEENVETPELQGVSPIDKSDVESLVKGLSHSPLISRPEGENLLTSASEPVTLDAIRQRLFRAKEQGQPFHVLHMLCHGLVRADENSYLVLERKNSNAAALISEDEFSENICEFAASGLKLVVLTSCYTAQLTGENALQGTARRLVRGGLPAVVAMQHKLRYYSAQYFSQRLYAVLVHYGEIDRAVNAARHELWLHRKRLPRDKGEERIPADEWGVPVLFTSLADGRLFALEERARQFSDPDANVQILPYEQTSGGNRQQLLEKITSAGARNMGIDLDALPWMQTRGETIIEVHQEPPSEPAREQFCIFGESGQKSHRWALIRAAEQYRQHNARRAMLFLRGIAYTSIARLIAQERLSELTSTEFQTQIWTGGCVRLGEQELRAILEDGPEESSDPLFFINETMQWRNGFRGFYPDEQASPVEANKRIEFTGNLTWNRPELASLPDGRYPGNMDLERLLYGWGDTFQVFDNVTSNEGKRGLGLDERTGSLLLHIVMPDEFVPYCRELAEQVLAKLDLQGDERYSNGFRGYCSLALDLLNDKDLGFESLVDVSYFLHRLSMGKVPWNVTAPPVDLRTRLQVVDLHPGKIDTELVLRGGVLEQAVAALNSGKHIILTGPPGTGKTTLAEDLCRAAHDQGCNRGHMLVTATADWTTFDTIGGYMPGSGNRLIFQSGIFLEAIKAGKWLIIDEINRADIDKAFGELFTVLSGQAVTLPYMTNGYPVRMLPPACSLTESACNYIVHPSWRIIGTMNVYDKASLFAMSYAFMRRFAFVDVTVPYDEPYKKLVELCARRAGLLSDENVNSLCELFVQTDGNENDLVRWRVLGPAIVKDVIEYLDQRGQGEMSKEHLAEALLLYVIPQFDGLERSKIISISHQLHRLFPGNEGDMLRIRIAELFPFISEGDLFPEQE